MPLNAGLEEAWKSYEVSFALIPMVSKMQPKASAQPGTKNTAVHAQPSLKGQRKGIFRSKPYGHTDQRKRAKTRASLNKGFHKIREAGGTTSTPDVDPICFDFPLKRCKEPVTDGRCRKGFHVCCLCYVNTA